jgi:hypothetical protein
LHDDTGLEALRQTGLIDLARGMMRVVGGSMKIVDTTGRVWWDETGAPELNPKGTAKVRQEMIGELILGGDGSIWVIAVRRKEKRY